MAHDNFGFLSKAASAEHFRHQGPPTLAVRRARFALILMKRDP